jgi:hypothetical protein
MVFEPKELSFSRVALCLALIGAFIGLGFLFVGIDVLKWIGLLLMAVPVVLVGITLLGFRKSELRRQSK